MAIFFSKIKGKSCTEAYGNPADAKTEFDSISSRTGPSGSYPISFQVGTVLNEIQLKAPDILRDFIASRSAFCSQQCESLPSSLRVLSATKHISTFIEHLKDPIDVLIFRAKLKAFGEGRVYERNNAIYRNSCFISPEHAEKLAGSIRQIFSQFSPDTQKMFLARLNFQLRCRENSQSEF